MKTVNKRMHFCLFVLLLAFSSAFKPCQQKSDFSGTWSLNKEQSDFGTVVPDRAAAVSMKIIQTTDAVTIERSFAGQPLNTETYTFDGKPVELTYPGTTVSRTLALSPDGKTITISSKYKVHRENEAAWEYTRSETYALAGDAKRLTLDRISVTPQGTEKVKAIYDKQ